jgi:hypothetical protein
MQPLPVPVPGGSVETLRSFLNVQSDTDFVLVVAWALAVLRDRGPYPVLALSGEQGSAKSTFSAILRALLDPNTAPLRALPREDRDLFIAASNGHLLAFDNVSGLPAWISDTLCRLATGGGFAVRQLYTDQDEVLFDAARPVILNGIEDIVTRPDLADRAVFLTLEPIPEDRRRPEQELWAAFEKERPRILSVLLDAVVQGLKMLPQTRLEKLPRMADFALWATACETAFWAAGTFATAFDANRKELIEGVLDADAIASAIRGLMASREEWVGTASQLLAALEEVAGERVTKAKNWPSSAEALGRGLRRPATFLRKVGIEISFERQPGGRRTRQIRITRNVEPGNRGEKPSQPSQPSQPSRTAQIGKEINGRGRDSSRDSRDSSGPEPSLEKDNEINAGNSRDSRDSKIPTQSDGVGPYDGIPEFLRRAPEPVCRRCGVPGTPHYGDLVRCGPDGSAGLFHGRCWTDEKNKRPLRKPALGPGGPGDSLDDLEM